MAKRKKKGAVAKAQAAVQRNVKQAKKAKKKYDEAFAKLALVIGVLGFVALAFLGVHWAASRLSPGLIPLKIPYEDFLQYLVIAVFCASFTGWLIVSDGQGMLEKKTGRFIALIAFGVLPIICLIASVFPVSVSDYTPLPAQDSHGHHPFWLFVRYYPLVMIGACLAITFKKEAIPRKHMKSKRALKFLFLTSPYIVILIFQELSLKEEILDEALGSTLGAVGINTQLILALMMASSYE